MAVTRRRPEGALAGRLFAPFLARVGVYSCLVDRSCEAATGSCRPSIESASESPLDPPSEPPCVLASRCSCSCTSRKNLSLSGVVDPLSWRVSPAWLVGRGGGLAMEPWGCSADPLPTSTRREASTPWRLCRTGARSLPCRSEKIGCARNGWLRTTEIGSDPDEARLRSGEALSTRACRLPSFLAAAVGADAAGRAERGRTRDLRVVPDRCQLRAPSPAALPCPDTGTEVFGCRPGRSPGERGFRRSTLAEDGR